MRRDRTVTGTCNLPVGLFLITYQPCYIRGGSNEGLVRQPAIFLTYPPSPNYSLLNNAFTAGDCGPGAVVVVVKLMCDLFPSYFDIEKVPKYAAEVRCLLSVLLVSCHEFDVHFESIDPLVATPHPGTLFCGVLQQLRFRKNRYEKTDSVAWRKRLAFAVCFGEGTRVSDGRRCRDSRQVIWFTLDVVMFLVQYVLRQAFIGDLTKMEFWFENHGCARHSMGPICFVPAVAPWCPSTEQIVPNLPYEPYAICVLHVGSHFQVHFRRTSYNYKKVSALTCPYLDCPSRYDSMYVRSPNSVHGRAYTIQKI